MKLLRKDLQPVTLIKSSGQKYENISVNLQSECGKVLTTNFEIPFEEGDVFQRVLKNGIIEKYLIIQVNQSQNIININIKKITKVEDEKFRARQNVVFEHGYLMAKLGRNHVTAFVKEVETPGDITGVVYTNMDSAGAWKFELAKNMQAVGINIDLNKFLQ